MSRSTRRFRSAEEPDISDRAASGDRQETGPDQARPESAEHGASATEVKGELVPVAGEVLDQSGRVAGRHLEHRRAAAQHAAHDSSHSAPERDEPAIPEATVARLATYLRVLTGMREQSVETVASEELAAYAGVNAGLLRKDLSYLGSYGTRGVGYLVSNLEEHLARTLGVTEDRCVVLIGIGNLGQALAGYQGFASRGFRIAGLIDADPARVGTTLHGMRVAGIDELDEVVSANDVSIGVIATPASAAQDVADRLVATGVSAILNFAPIVLSVPAHIDVRKVDLAGELQILSFHEHRKALLSEQRHMAGGS